MDITIFNKTIQLRDYKCQFYDNDPQLITEPYINLYVRFKGCNANCSFCEYKDSAEEFDFEKYEYILNELKSKLLIRKIGYTGGEPTLNYELFKKVLEYSYEKLPKIEHSVNSNGLRFKELYKDINILNKITHLHLSRHHYDDDLNNKTLGFKSLSTAELKELQSNITNPDFLQLSCNLIKGYIDNNDDILKYLEFANDVGVYRIGFVSLMPINKYCKDNYIGNDVVMNDKLFNTTQWNNNGFCTCSNYIYVPKNIDKNCVKLYTKNTFNVNNTNNVLSFNGKNLMVGFTNNIII